MTIKQQQITTLREALGDELFEWLEEETMDFPRAWEIARSVPVDEHDERCSYRVTNGGCLCDCYVITWHKKDKEKMLKFLQEDRGYKFTTWNTICRELFNIGRIKEVREALIKEGKVKRLKNGYRAIKEEK